MPIILTGTVSGRNHKPPGDNMHGVMNNGQPWPMDQVKTIEDVRLTVALDSAHALPREIQIMLPSLPAEQFRIGQRVKVVVDEQVPEPVAPVKKKEPIGA